MLNTSFIIIVSYYSYIAGQHVQMMVPTLLFMLVTMKREFEGPGDSVALVPILSFTHLDHMLTLNSTVILDLIVKI